MRLRQIRVRNRHHVAVYVTASGQRIEQRRVDRLHGALHVRLNDTVKLERLARGQPQRAVGIGARDGVKREPLLRRDNAGGNANADHEAEGLLQLLLRALWPQVAVVLQIGTVELCKLGIVLGDGAGRNIGEPLRDGTAQEPAVLLDELVS